MSNSITPTEADISKLVLHGDLGSLTPEQKSQYYILRCREHGLNPSSQPFNYLKLNGKEVLYANKGCAEQLRSINKVSIKITKADKVGDIFVVIAEAKDGQGREDSATGAVPIIGLKGEALANAMMKAETKAKRRVTLSICGINMLDESEIDSIDKAPNPHAAKNMQPSIEDGAKGVSVRSTVNRGQFAKRNISELSQADLEKLVGSVDAMDSPTTEDLQDRERALELLNLYEEPQAEDDAEQATPICEGCNQPFGVSKYPDRFTGIHNWYCFKCKVSKVRT